MDELTISIVNYNSGEYLKRCLKSIKAIEKEAQIKTVVLDNDSTDASLQGLEDSKNLKIIKNSNNVGFGRAHNQILKSLKTKYVLILNPDCEVTPGTIKYLLGYMNENPDVGAVTCKLIKEDGTIDWASHRGFPTPWASFLYYVLGNDSLYHLSGRDMERTHEVDAIVGAFFLTRKSVLDKVGTFDEQYFMYGEDIDLCLRIKAAGFKVMYVPEVSAKHFKGISSGLKKHSQNTSQASSETKLRAFNAFYDSMKIFYKKHYEKKYPFFINWLIYLGIYFKQLSAKRKLTV